MGDNMKKFAICVIISALMLLIPIAMIASKLIYGIVSIFVIGFLILAGLKYRQESVLNTRDEIDMDDTQ